MQFPEFQFVSELRPSQKDVVEMAQRQLEQGQRRLHVVAPPGSGKTVVGLYLWAMLIRRPALVLSPNSAIQSQWAARVDLFDVRGGHLQRPITSMDPTQPALLNSLTYQSVTLPQRGSASLDQSALETWMDQLIEAGQAEDPLEAKVWIGDLQTHNPDYYEDRLGVYRKQVRDAAALDGQAVDMLHRNAQEILQRLRDAEIGVVILDECHHLLGHWGRVLADAHDFLERPIVIGLTATPPDRDGKSSEDVKRYDEFLGPIDYEVPVPAVVKDGFLAPYQDLAYFVRPTAEEVTFIANADRALREIVVELCQERRIASQTKPRSSVAAGRAEETVQSSHEAVQPSRAEPLVQWLQHVLKERQLPTGPVATWFDFAQRDPVFADAARRFLRTRGIPLPDGVPELDDFVPAGDATAMDALVPVMDRYIRHSLRRSGHPDDHRLAETAVQRLRLLGVQITETGSRACASPVARVLAYSTAKVDALLEILDHERRALGDRIRAVIVTDYEKTSAVTAEVTHLLDAEAGGAIAAFRALLKHEATDPLDPVLVTGSSVLVDDDLAPRLLALASEWLASRNIRVELHFDQEDGFKVLNGRGADWCPRVYVHLLTDLFQQGVTKCLVGTRGLLGEGWDAHTINVLVDMTTVTTSMSVNQLRGRSIRLDPDDPRKLANNWDIVSVAPEFTRGLQDYDRFRRKHETVFGVTDDGAIEKGVGHVHAAFTSLEPEELEHSVAALNSEMLERAARRDHVRRLWRIGEPYHPEPVHTFEARPTGMAGGFPPFSRSPEPWSETSLTLAISTAVLAGLEEAGLIRQQQAIQLAERSGGYLRAFLREATSADSIIFAEALHEAMGRLRRPRYVIPRYVDHITDTWLSQLLPVIVGRYFQRRRRQIVMLHAVPSVLAKNKELAQIYQKHWNRHVSPGDAVYALRGEGEQLLREAQSGNLVPRGPTHTKEVFL